MKRELKIVFTKAEGYRLVPVTGTWGGVSPSGEIIVECFVERSSFPEPIHLVLEEGQPVQEEVPPLSEYPRESQVGLVLRPDIAHSVGMWLIEKAKEAGFRPQPNPTN